MKTALLLALLLPGCGLLFPRKPAEEQDAAAELKEGKGTLVLRRGAAHVLVALSDGRTERHRLTVGAARLTTPDAGTLSGLNGLIEIALTSWSNQPDHAEARSASGADLPPLLDERLREVFFETARVPSAHVQVLDLEAVAQPFGVDESAELSVTALVILDGRAVRTTAPVEVTRTTDGYRFVTRAPIPLDLDDLDKGAALPALVAALGLPAAVEPVVGLTLELETGWKRPGEHAQVPVAPPVTVTRVTGDGAIDLSKVRPKEPLSTGRDTGGR